MKKFRAGVIGCGRIGSEFDKDPKRKTIASHCGAYAFLDFIDFAAISDSDENKLKAAATRWKVPNTYQDYLEMLRKEKLDILSICTWDFTHLNIVKHAVASGVRAIYCEKPIAECLESAHEMISCCKQNSVRLQINHQRRFDLRHQQLQQSITSGKLGRIQSASFYYTAGIANTGSHMFDLLRFFLGNALWVQGTFSENSSHKSDDPNIDGVILFENNVFVSIHACDVKSYAIFEMDILGTLGRVRIMNSGTHFEWSHVHESDLFSGYKELRFDPKPQESVPASSSIVEGVKHLAACLQNGQDSISSGEDGKRSLELILALKESSKRHGERISIPFTQNPNAFGSR